jgi:hypothetical protein
MKMTLMTAVFMVFAGFTNLAQASEIETAKEAALQAQGRADGALDQVAEIRLTALSKITDLEVVYEEYTTYKHLPGYDMQLHYRVERILEELNDASIDPSTDPGLTLKNANRLYLLAVNAHLTAVQNMEQAGILEQAGNISEAIGKYNSATNDFEFAHRFYSHSAREFVSLAAKIDQFILAIEAAMSLLESETSEDPSLADGDDYYDYYDYYGDFS